MRFYSAYSIFVLFLVVFVLPASIFAQQTILTKEQNEWLNKNNRTILVHPQDFEPPFVFSSSGTKKESKGFSIEYFNLILKKINAKVVFSQPAPLNQILAGARERNDGIILSLTPTEEREQYLYFTDSYYTTPSVVVVRKDFYINKKLFSLSDFIDKRVAVGNSYAAQSYIESNYPKMELTLVADDQIGLQKLLLGEVDALVMDFASYTYYTANDVLSYVKIIGRTGFDYKHSIAVPKSSPELVLILNEALKSIPDAEKQVLINKWMGSDLSPLSSSASDVAPETPNNLKTWLLFIGFLIVLMFIVILVTVLYKKNRDNFSRKLFRKKEFASEVKEELEELKIARETLKEDIAQISELEKDIQEKIEKIDR
jgi:ABC-type amino acid transport substrate-binding protein